MRPDFYSPFLGGYAGYVAGIALYFTAVTLLAVWVFRSKVWSPRALGTLISGLAVMLLDGAAVSRLLQHMHQLVQAHLSWGSIPTLWALTPTVGAFLFVLHSLAVGVLLIVRAARDKSRADAGSHGGL